MKLEFNVKGKDRKALVAAVAEMIGTEQKYCGPPRYEFTIGEYTVDREGTLTGPDNTNLGTGLAEKGFGTVTQLDDIVLAAEPEDAAETGAEPAKHGLLTIEMPTEGFTPEKLENLRKLVDSKASLIKKTLGIDELPIITTEAGTIGFPWFKPDSDGETITAYSQFVAALCKTAQEKTRVTAQERDFTNEKFSLRVFLIGLGLIGPEYRLIRKLLGKNLSGNSAWSSGVDPRRKTKLENNTIVSDVNVDDNTGEGGDTE